MDVLSISVEDKVRVYETTHTGHKRGVVLLKGRTGRETLFKSEMLRQAQYLAQFGMCEYQIAKVWGVSEHSITRWKRKNPEFLKAIEKGKASASVAVSKAVLDAATNGNMVAAIFWLTNREPETWRDRRALVNNKIVTGVHVSGDGERESKVRQLVNTWSPQKKAKFASIVDSVQEQLLTIEQDTGVEADADIE